MAGKFSLKKFERDRKKSLERSKKGELDLIIPSKMTTILNDIVERHQKERHPLYSATESCGHKRALGCDLPFHKRTKPECEACL